MFDSGLKSTIEKRWENPIKSTLRQRLKRIWRWHIQDKVESVTLFLIVAIYHFAWWYGIYWYGQVVVEIYIQIHKVFFLNLNIT